MEFLFDKIKKDKKKETIFSAFFLLTAATLFLLSFAFSNKVDLWAIIILIFIFVAVLINYLITVYRINKQLYGNNEQECREIIKYLQKISPNFDHSVFWWVDTKKKVAVPAIMIPPTPSIWQKIANFILRRRGLMRHAKYDFRIINANGKLGKKITGKNVFSKEEATNFLDFLERNKK